MALFSKTSSQRKKRRNEDTTNYWRTYGLTKEPFSLVPDLSQSLLFGKWEHHLDLLQHLIHTENVILAVFGVKGIGKTTLMQQLKLQITETMTVHSVNADPGLTLNQLINVLQEGFKLPKTDAELLEEKLDSQITDLQYRDRICVLVIDNAEKLPEDTLQALIYLIKQQSKTQMRLHIVLFGDHELQIKLARLARQELSGDLIHSIELDPLTLEETKQYLQYRLTTAGLKNSSPLIPETIDEIYHLSNGVPEQINRAAERALIENMTEYNMPFTPGFFVRYKTKVLGGCVIAAVFGLVVTLLNHQASQNNVTASQAKPVLAFNHQTSNVSDPPANQNVANNQTNNVASQQGGMPVQQPVNHPYYQINTPANADANSAANNNQQSGNNYDNAQTQAQTAPNQPGVASQPAMGTTAMNQQDNQGYAPQPDYQNDAMNSDGQPLSNAPNSPHASMDNAAPQNNTVASSVPTNPNASPAAQNNTAANTVPADQSVSAAANNNMVASAAPSGQSASSVNNASMSNAEQAQLSPNQNESAAVVAQTNTPTQPIVHHHSIHKSMTHSKVATSEAATNPSAQNLMAVPGHKYTLQIVALSHEDAMKNFIIANHLSGKAHYFTSQRNGKTLYVLVYGEYTSAAAAKSAIKDLPAAIQKNPVWARSYSAVQDEIRAGRG